MASKISVSLMINIATEHVAARILTDKFREDFRFKWDFCKEHLPQNLSGHSAQICELMDALAFQRDLRKEGSLRSQLAAELFAFARERTLTNMRRVENGE